MKFPFGSPSRGRAETAASLIALVCLLAASPVAALAHKNEAAKPSARPVARMLSSTRQEAPQRARARMVAAFRNNASAMPSGLTATRAAAAPAIASATSSERRVFELINEQRRERGRRPLAWDGELTRMARYHSQNMARQDFFNHVDRDGLDMSGRAELLGVGGWRALAENIAFNQGYDDPESFAVERWMISNKHRENILNGEFTHAGLGVARASDGRVYFTQVFVKR